MNNVLIFGASSKLAEETVKHIKGVNLNVMLAGPTESKINTVKAHLKTLNPKVNYQSYIIDALDYEKHQELYDYTISEFGGLDTVIIAHGTLPDNEEVRKSQEKSIKEFNINCVSVISLCTIAANYFEKQKSGTIAVISSVAGERGRQSNYIYGSAKAGVSAFLQGLRNRMFEFGVSVVTIKPGMVRTPMTSSLPDSPLFAKADKVGKEIYDGIRKKKDVVYTPSYWNIIMTIIKLIPEGIFKKLKL